MKLFLKLVCFFLLLTALPLAVFSKTSESVAIAITIPQLINISQQDIGSLQEDKELAHKKEILVTEETREKGFTQRGTERVLLATRAAK